MNNKQQSRLRRSRGIGLFPFIFPPATPARWLAYLVCLGILIPSLGFAAYLLSVMHTRELRVLHESAHTRAMLAASLFNDEMGGLLQTLKAIPAAPTATENVYDRVRTDLKQKGILLVSRSESLDLLSPVSENDAGFVNLDGAARAAAIAAVSTLAPQITTYGGPENGGVNIWIASAAKDAAPAVFQARVPSSFFLSAFERLVSDGAWSISIVGADGQIFAEAGRNAAATPNAEVGPNTPLVQAYADTSQFGWKIAAEAPEEPIEIRAHRNWMTFIALSSALAVASFIAATLLTRSLLEEPRLSNISQAIGMPSQFNRKGNSSPLAPARNGEDRLRSALLAGNIGVWEWNLETALVHFDAGTAGVLGDLARTSGLTARKLLRHVEPYDRRRLLKAAGAAIAQSRPFAIEVRLRRPDRETCWVAVRGAPTTIRNGEVIGLSGVAYDITDQKLSLTRTDALLREVSHRTKNLLALILAMARLTARDAVDVKSHLKDFTLRVAGLAASQDLIVASDWQSVDLSTLASAEIGAVARTDADRIAIAGPPVLLTPEAAQTLGMVLTELALNAVEHGALSSATGQVQLSWDFPDEASIEISWRETGGPPFKAEGSKGYGMSVVERFSTQGLKLVARAAATTSGFMWTLSGPLANIGTRPETRS